MKRLMMLAVLGAAVCATTILTESADAQVQVNGYRFGVGVRQSRQVRNFGIYRNFGFVRSSLSERVAEPPYFALHPPVYYSEQVIRRPYGVSPFAAPAGIVPVEMQMPPKPARIINPHALPDSLLDQPEKEEKKEDGGEKTT